MDVIGAWTVITLGNDAAILNYSTEEIWGEQTNHVSIWKQNGGTNKRAFSWGRLD